MPRPVLFRLCLILGLVLGLAACQSSEDRAEEHYQNALRLIEEGDFDRASVEFRNVLQNDGRHREARSRFAQMLRDTGDLQGSYSQYLRLAEQYPDDAPARIALAQMAIDGQSWDEAQRHGERAINLAPEDPAIPVIELNLAYAAAVEDQDEPARREVADQARAMLQDTPDEVLLRRILIDSALRDGDLETALAEVEATLAIDPDSRPLYDTKLAILAQFERSDEVEVLLRDMIARFPEDAELQGTLLRFYVARGETDAAGDFLREVVETTEDPEQRLDARTALIRLALELDGPEAGLAELDAQIGAIDAAAEPGPVATLRALRAGILFDQGSRPEAIAEMEEVLAGELPTEEAGRLRVALSRMLMATGNQVGARALIEEVLAADATQTEALKMRASWLIEEDETREAISLLRTALDNSPEDVEAMTLMAQAHLRNGDRSLAREFLALAAEASNSAPVPTIRYADFLIADEQFLVAEEILIRALRLVPGDLSLLTNLGQLYVRMEDWPRTEQVEATLRRLETPDGARAADGLQVARLAAQGQTDDAIAFLEDLAGQNEGDMAAQIAVIRTRLASGQGDEALRLARELAESDPENLALRFALASTQAAIGLNAEAAESYRTILAAEPRAEQAWTELVRVLYAQGDIEGADAALAEGLEALPGALNLLWAQASFLEQRGDFEGAIAVYEAMYERAPNQPVIANNLASLITTYRDDDESLERAYTVARRLRGSDFAPFQDTYGWIAYRRGEYDEALEHLEPAAEALADDPLVQFHLGMTYAALDRGDEAIAQLQRAVDMAEAAEDSRAQFETARAEIARLETAAAETEASGQ